MPACRRDQSPILGWLRFAPSWRRWRRITCTMWRGLMARTSSAARIRNTWPPSAATGRSPNAQMVDPLPVRAVGPGAGSQRAGRGRHPGTHPRPGQHGGRVERARAHGTCAAVGRPSAGHGRADVHRLEQLFIPHAGHRPRAYATTRLRASSSLPHVVAGKYSDVTLRGSARVNKAGGILVLVVALAGVWPPIASAESLFAAGRAAHLAGRHLDAVVALRAYLADHPTDAGAWVWLGGSYYQLGSVPDAVMCFERAMAFQPSGETALWLGAAYAQVGRDNDAR